MFDGGDEELAQPAPRRRLWQVVAVLGAAVVVAGIVVGVARHETGSSGPAPSPSVTSSGLPAPVANGPVIPTFAPQTADPNAPYGSSLRITLLVGRPRTPVTVDGDVPLLFGSCIGGPKRCSSRFRVPDAVRQAMRAQSPGCAPVINDLIEHRSGTRHVVDRQVLCKRAGISVLANIARVRSANLGLRVRDAGTQVIVSDRHGPYTVQVVEQGTRRHRPDVASAPELAADPRLLAGT